jgi:hypothetical protein
MLLRVLVCALLLFVSVDLVKNISPNLCSRPGHYHLVGYNKTTSHAASGVRWQSGRPVLKYSGGKDSCKPAPAEGFGKAVFVYDLAAQLAAFLLGLPASGCEMLINNVAICLIVRFLNTLAAAAYLLIAIAHYAIAGRLVLDLSATELDAVKDAFRSLRKLGGRT